MANEEYTINIYLHLRNVITHIQLINISNKKTLSEYAVFSTQSII